MEKAKNSKKLKAKISEKNSEIIKLSNTNQNLEAQINLHKETITNLNQETSNTKEMMNKGKNQLNKYLDKKEEEQKLLMQKYFSQLIDIKQTNDSLKEKMT